MFQHNLSLMCFCIFKNCLNSKSKQIRFLLNCFWKVRGGHQIQIDDRPTNLIFVKKPLPPERFQPHSTKVLAIIPKPTPMIMPKIKAKTDSLDNEVSALIPPKESVSSS